MANREEKIHLSTNDDGVLGNILSVLVIVKENPLSFIALIFAIRKQSLHCLPFKCIILMLLYNLNRFGRRKTRNINFIH